jgi:N-carbamoyl-L-amino-acid hydrolase
MKEFFTPLRIDNERFRANFEALAAIGATLDGGVNRPALSDAHLDARRWFLESAKEIGLEARSDGAGNHSALLRCGRDGGPTLLLGSHLDSVPFGGRFDGALGVVAALEVLQVVKEAGIKLNAHLEAIDFTDEEGRFVDFLGSLALSGKLEPKQIENPGGGRDHFQKALRRAGLSESSLLSAGRDPGDVAGYLELHAEQGRRLVERNMHIGIVTGVVGIRSFRIRFVGQADHAGTAPMEERLDGAQGASAFTLAARELVMAEFPGCVVNVGNMEFEPGVFNVVPQIVTVALQFRAENDDKLDDVEAALLRQASVEAQRFGLSLEIEPLGRVSAAHMNDRVQEAFVSASKTLGLRYIFLSSGAGHDAQCLTQVCPAGMIFVPSVGGFSHSSREYTEWQDCVNGANVLLQAALILAQ